MDHLATKFCANGGASPQSRFLHQLTVHHMFNQKFHSRMR